MFKKLLALLLVTLLLMNLAIGCAAESPADSPAAPAAAIAPEAQAQADVSDAPVTLTIAGGWPDCRAIENAANAFSKEYPNCTIVYEYVQDYYESVAKRMEGDEPFDLFITTNIQAESPMLPYVVDLNSCEGLDLTNTFDGLQENFLFREESGENKKLYAIPFGAEMRGLYVNTTLLNSLGIAVPTDQASLLAACQTLKDNGYIAFHGNPGAFAQTLVYPWFCNLIVNADDPAAVYARVDAREPGISELFRAPCEFLYTLVENGYYDYKKAQTDLGLFLDAKDEAYARDFLHIKSENDTFTKVDDLGQVAFMPSPMSLQSTIAKTKDDYHSGIEYVFIPAPVGPDGGYAYLSPAHGIAVGNRSQNLDWAVRFLNFLFTPENNEAFAETFGILPNTKETFSYITAQYDLPSSRISHLGEVTFSYDFYNAVQSSIIDISKGNNPKYMLDDGKGNLSLYPLEYYMAELETNLQQQ